jgi:ABC-2 type transport system permease protein
MQAMQFRFDFFFRILMDVAFYLVSLLFYKVLFTQTSGLAGWTEAQVMIFISGFLVVDAIQMTVFANGTWMIPIYVNKGELDYYLLRPVSSLFFLSTRDFAFNSVINLIIAAGIMIWAFFEYPGNFELSKIIFYTFLIINGTYLFFLMRIMMLLPVFWTHNGRGLEMIFWTLNKFSERPDGIFRGLFQKALVSIMPFAIICSVPARFLFQENSWHLAGYCILVTVVFHLVSVSLWNLGLKNYSSASS